MLYKIFGSHFFDNNILKLKRESRINVMDKKILKSKRWQKNTKTFSI